MDTSISGVTAAGLPPALSDAQDRTSASVGQVANQETFLKLLVAQIKNQNPLDPTDGTQFVAQLAQFSELEQTIGIRSEIQSLRQDFEKAAAQNPTEKP